MTIKRFGAAAMVAAILILLLMLCLPASAQLGNYYERLRVGKWGETSTGQIVTLDSAGLSRTVLDPTGYIQMKPVSLTGTCLSIDGSVITSGTLLQLKCVDATLNGGYYINCLGGTGTTSEFSVTEGGAIAAAGEITGSGPKHYLSVPLGIAQSATTYTEVFCPLRAMTITKATVSLYTVFGTSTATLALTNWHSGSGKNILGSSTYDLTGLSTKSTHNLTLISTGTDLALAAGDYLYAAVAEGATTVGGGGLCLTLEYTLQ